MRKCFALVLLVTFSWIGGVGQDARAGVTIDVVFQDAFLPSAGLTIVPGDPFAPGCTFGYYGRVVTGVRCMDVVLKSTDDLVGFSMSVAYDSDEGLALVDMYEWKGVGVSFNKYGAPQKSCAPTGGLEDNGGILQSFDCSIPEPTNPPVLAAGTYKIGTILWDASCLVQHEWGAMAAISAYIDDLVDAFTAVRNGNIVDISDEVTVGGHFFSIPGTWSEVCGDCDIEHPEACDDGGTTPGDGCDANCQIESGWTCEGEPSVCSEESTPVPSVGATGVAVLGVAVFGIGLVGLVIAARRRHG